MKNECLICGEPLEYLNEDVETECEICHKKENSKTRCVKGHYVCSECHMKGADSIISALAKPQDPRWRFSTNVCPCHSAICMALNII